MENNKAITRQTLLRHTLWGVDIYAHILRLYYPENTVMKITGRDCGICRNPFANGETTLHIWYSKDRPELPLSEETARHHDTGGTIPDGDALDFAALHYHLTGQDLINTLNKEMNLHLEAKSRPAHLQEQPKGPKFSYFDPPISNIRPSKSITISQAWDYITGHSAKACTEKLRNITSKSDARTYKASHFAYATFSGEFTVRKNDALIAESGLLCIDFDHLTQPELLRDKLPCDRYFETALLFRSPSGDGIKWVIETDPAQRSDPRFFRALENYILHTYTVPIDSACKDISRACFLPHDPEAFINPKYE